VSNGIDSATRRALIACAFVVSVLLALSFVLIQTSRSGPEPAVGRPLSDDQAKAQVVEPARQIGAIGHLQRASGGYTLISCTNEADPPYQGMVFLRFDLPSDASGYFKNLAATMIAHGWTEGPAPNREMPGKMLSKDGVTAIFNRNSDYLQMGTARIYGECRNVNDHRKDTAAWLDITDQLR
jgi:hypothetical protein